MMLPANLQRQLFIQRTAMKIKIQQATHAIKTAQHIGNDFDDK